MLYIKNPITYHNKMLISNINKIDKIYINFVIANE